MARVTVDAGICGFKTVIHATSEDMQHAVVTLETPCPNLRPLAGRQLELDAFEVCFAKLGEASVFELFKEHGKHPGCPVASGVIKGVEVACGLALAKDATIQVSKEDD